MSRRIAIVIVVAWAATGCCGGGGGLEGTIPIRGKVTLNGQPLQTGEVRYLPVDASAGRVARGKLDNNGHFELTTLKTGDGALPGEYCIVIVSRPSRDDDVDNLKLPPHSTPVISLVPKRYCQPDTSGLSDTVDDGHEHYKEIDLVD